MNIMLIKTGFYLAFMIVFLIMAFITKDQAKSQLLASFGIITGAIASINISNQTQKNNE